MTLELYILYRGRMSRMDRKTDRPDRPELSFVPLIYPRCPECRAPLSSYMPFVDVVRQGYNSKRGKPNVAPLFGDDSAANGSDEFSMRELFEVLNIDKYCCRQHLCAIVDHDRTTAYV